MKQAFLSTLAVISGCAMTYDAVQVGPDRDQTSADASPARGAIAGAQRLALEAANKKCASLGKQVSVVNIDTGHDFPTNGRAVVTFDCMSPTAPGANPTKRSGNEHQPHASSAGGTSHAPQVRGPLPHNGTPMSKCRYVERAMPDARWDKSWSANR